MCGLKICEYGNLKEVSKEELEGNVSWDYKLQQSQPDEFPDESDVVPDESFYYKLTSP